MSNMETSKHNKLGRVFSLLKRTKPPLFVILFLGLHWLVLNNFLLMSKDMIRGDFSAHKIVPQPVYRFGRVRRSQTARDCKAVNRFAGDFAQVYFPSREFTSSSATCYTKKTVDPWHRPSMYAPLIHAVCSVSLSKLDYGHASFLHILIQLLLFYLAFIYAFKVLHIERYVFHGILLVNFCLFLTPVGLAWFERGQFSLYVSMAYLWLVLGIINRKAAYIFLSALFAYIKWTSFPFIFVALVLWMLNSKNIKELKQSILLALVFAATIALLFLAYSELGMTFIAAIAKQELDFSPSGLSLMKVLPRFMVKVLPFALIALGYLHIRRFKNNYAFLLPCMAGCGIILLTYPTKAFNYSVPCLFCFIPLLIYWAKLPTIQKHTGRVLMKYLFVLFILVASFSNRVAELSSADPLIVTIYAYILFALVFLLLPLFYRADSVTAGAEPSLHAEKGAVAKTDTPS
jgi:hypothetical protein